MAKRENARKREIEESKIPCNYCKLKPVEKNYAGKTEICDGPDTLYRHEPFITDYKCGQDKNDCELLIKLISLDHFAKQTATEH